MKALPAFWVGLLYDSVAIDEAAQLGKNWSAADRADLHLNAPRFGFEAEFGGHKVLEVAKAAVTIAQHGLRRRAMRLHGGVDETRYLDVLFDVLDAKQNRADYLLMQATHFPDFKIENLFRTERLIAAASAADAA